MSKKIGFDRSDDQEPEEDELEKIKKAEREALKPFILANYLPIGSTDQKEFKTSMELQYELHEMIDFSTKTLNLCLAEMGFKIEFVEYVPLWVMYSLNCDLCD